MLVTILPGLHPPRLRPRDREREGRALDHRRPPLPDQVSPSQVGAGNDTNLTSNIVCIGNH